MKTMAKSIRARGLVTRFGPGFFAVVLVCSASAREDDAKAMLANGGFEDGNPSGSAPDGWEKGAAIAGVAYDWDRTVAHQGRASLHLRKTAPRYFPIGQWSQTVKRSGATPRLKVGAFAKAEQMTKATLDVQFVGRGGERTHGWAAYIGAREVGEPPVTHDWKWYERVVSIPDGTEQLIIAAQIWGPGDVWFDDVVAEYTTAALTDPIGAKPAPPPVAPARPDADMADVPAEERKAGGDPRKRYFLIGPTGGPAVPAEGYRLLLILPGGDGSAEFEPFVRRIARNGLPPGYLVAQLVAVAWTPQQAQELVWPTVSSTLPGVGFPTEEFIDTVLSDIARTKKIDPRFVFALGWSSGGPPVYATALRPASRLTGSLIATSVFRPAQYPPLANARGQGYYLLHSPQDFIPIGMAETARDELRRAGAKVELRRYEGGHGWHGDVFGEIRRGVEWLEANHSAPAGR